MASTQDLVIVGFSGFGREVYWLARRLGIRVRGFLDDNPAVLGATFSDVPVLGETKSWSQFSDCQFVVAIGNPRTRMKVVGKMLSSGSPYFATLIDPSAIVSRDLVNVGIGSIICAGTVCTTDISLGEHVIVNLNCTVGHDVYLDDYVTVAPMVAISGNVSIAKTAEIGTGASIRQGLTVGSGAMVGMGSVVTKSVANNNMVFGSPAKVMKVLQGE